MKPVRWARLQIRSTRHLLCRPSGQSAECGPQTAARPTGTWPKHAQKVGTMRPLYAHSSNPSTSTSSTHKQGRPTRPNSLATAAGVQQTGVCSLPPTPRTWTSAPPINSNRPQVAAQLASPIPSPPPACDLEPPELAAGIGQRRGAGSWRLTDEAFGCHRRGGGPLVLSGGLASGRRAA